MNQGLGPVVGNRFDDARKTALKPHLMQRLVEQTVRAVPLGTLISEGGLMAFVPNYVDPRTAAPVARKAAPAEIVSRGEPKPAATAFDPMTEPLQLGDYVEVVFQGDGTGVKETGKRGKVARIHHVTGVALAYDDGTEDTGPGWGNRSSLKLLARKANG